MSWGESRSESELERRGEGVTEEKNTVNPARVVVQRVDAPAKVYTRSDFMRDLGKVSKKQPPKKA